MNLIPAHRMIYLFLGNMVCSFIAFTSDYSATEGIHRECQKFDATVRGIYIQGSINKSKKENITVNHPFLILSLDEKYWEARDDLLRKTNTSPIAWIQGLEKYLLQKTQEQNNTQTFLWEPYIFVALRNHPEIGRLSIKGFVNKCQSFSSRNCIDLFSFLSPNLDCFAVRDAVEETAIICIFCRLLRDTTPSYDYFWKTSKKIGVFDLETGINHPTWKNAITKPSLRKVR